MKILVSACLLGENCKYNGGNNFSAAAARLAQDHQVIRVCPEVLAGLGIPRTPIEIVNGVLTDRKGKCVDDVLRKTVAELVAGLKNQKIDCAILQSRSPTCGVNQVYDGTFTGKLIPGMGVFARGLEDAGIKVIDVEDITNEQFS